MPKLASDQARQAEQAHLEGPKDQGPLVPEAMYLGKLKEVEVSNKPGPSGHHYWVWTFELQDEGYEGVEKALITSLSPDAAFAVGGAFAAFHVPADTDTDELLGQFAVLEISQVPIEKGSRKGELTNRVEKLHPVDGDLEREVASASGGGVTATDF